MQDFREHGNFLSIESQVEMIEYEIEDAIYQNPTSSYIEIKMCDYQNNELGNIKLSNSQAIYLSRLILENITLIND